MKLATCAIAGLDHAQGCIAAIQPEIAHLLRRAMAAVATFLENGPHVTGVVDCRGYSADS